MPVTVQQHQRPHGDARRLHIDEQIADAVMFGRFGIGAHQQKAPIGEMRARGPHLLPVDKEMVAAIDGARPEASKVAAGAGFGKALTPALLAGEDARQMALFLRLGAALDQRRTQEVDGASPRQDRGAGAEILLVENHLLHKAGAAPAIFFRPGNPDPAGGVHLFLPGDALFQGIAVGGDALVGGVIDLDFLGEIVVKPLPELGAESGMLRAVGEIHRCLPHRPLLAQGRLGRA